MEWCARRMAWTVPFTKAVIVSGTQPVPASWKIVFWRNPEGPECVCVPEMAMEASL